MSARKDILETVRRSLQRQPGDGAEAAVAARLAEHPRGPVPQRGQLQGEALLALFVAQAEGVSATVARVATPAEVPEAVADYLKGVNLPPKLRLAPHPALRALPWRERAPLLEIAEGRAEAEDAVSVTTAFAGVAETGTLMLHSGPQSPTTLNFLPETHVVVLQAEQVVGAYEEAWDRLRAAARGEGGGGGGLPRTVNFITGPSRTGDIEQQIQLGAHGPRRLHVVLVGDGRDPA